MVVVRTKQSGGNNPPERTREGFSPFHGGTWYSCQLATASPSVSLLGENSSTSSCGVCYLNLTAGIQMYFCLVLFCEKQFIFV